MVLRIVLQDMLVCICVCECVFRVMGCSSPPYAFRLYEREDTVKMSIARHHFPTLLSRSPHHYGLPHFYFSSNPLTLSTQCATSDQQPECREVTEKVYF